MISLLDNYHGSYEKKVTQLFQEFRQVMLSPKNKEAAENLFSSDREELVYYDYTSSLFKKRIDATFAYRDKARRELKGIASATEIDSLFAYSNALVLRGGYTNTDIYISVIIASAIWILDQLNIQGKIEEIYPYLPAVDDKDILVSAHHPQYDPFLIASVIKLIFMRNRENYDPMEISEDPRTLMSEKAESAPREAYDAVISLIDPQAIQNAKEKYERKVWEFYRLTFSAYVALQNEQDRIENEIEDLRRKTLSASPVLARSFTVAGNYNDSETEQIKKLEYQLERLVNSGWLTEMGLSDSREKTARRFRYIIGEDLVEELTHFEVDDPFEYAFALHLLFDEGSLVPWIYYGSICVTYTFVDQLPFDISSFVEKGSPHLLKDIGSMLYTHKFKGIRYASRTDCRGEPIERTFGKNLSQILYYSSHTLYPRVADQMPELDSFFADLNLENEKDKQLYALLIYLLSSSNKDQESLQAYRLSREIEKMAQEDDVEHESVDTSDLEKTVAGLQSRIDALSRALYEETRLKKNAVSKNNQLLSENERLVRELADLREIVFAQQSDEPIETNEREEFEFPILTTGHIVSFGGHPGWINEMKKFLPNVQFYSPEVLPNKDAIKNADQVWVQTQCISHAAFYRIESVLGKNTPLRFFPNQNARCCAEKMAEALLKGK